MYSRGSRRFRAKASAFCFPPHTHHTAHQLDDTEQLAKDRIIICLYPPAPVPVLGASRGFFDFDWASTFLVEEPRSISTVMAKSTIAAERRDVVISYFSVA